MTDPNDMDAQNRRAERILTDFAAGVNEATGLPAIETPGYVIVPVRLETISGADIAAGNWPGGNGPKDPLRDPLAIENLPIEAVITMAEGIKLNIVQAQQDFDAEIKPLTDGLEKVEARIRAHVLEHGKVEGDHLKAIRVDPKPKVTWNDDRLQGFASGISPDQRAMLLKCRTETPSTPQVRLTYK